MPDAVRLRHLARLVDQDVEGETVVLDVPPHDFGSLRDDGDDLDASRRIFRGVLCQFTEPASAIRSPCAAMKGQEQRSARQKAGERTHVPFLSRQLERRSGGSYVHGIDQKNLISTISPASTMSVWAGISMYPSACDMLVISPDALNAGTAAPSTSRTV